LFGEAAFAGCHQVGGPRGAPQSARRLRTRLSNGREPPTLRRARPEGPRTPPKGAGTAGRRQWGGPLAPLRRLQTPTRPPSSPCREQRRAQRRAAGGSVVRPSLQTRGPPPLVPLQGCWPRGLPGRRGGFDPYGALPSPSRQGGLEGGPSDLWPPPHRGN